MKPGIPKGTRDFSPAEMVKRNYIFDTIKGVFMMYGYLPIETPAFENLSTLTGKYGEEGDKLIFKILNSGDFLKEAEPTSLANKDSKKLTSSIAEKALRYDLTVPFARYVVMHQNEITFPFKRYQIQPVWRADRPQKGRYREFYQCDADVIGSNSMLNEVELIQIIDEVFAKLNLRVTIKINNRKILFGIAEELNRKERLGEIITALDKIDKIGGTAVLEELKLNLNLDDQQTDFFYSLINRQYDKDVNSISTLFDIFKDSEVGKLGTNELNEVCTYFQGFNAVLEPIIQLRNGNSLEQDFSLARGLDYYTGAIIEVKVNDPRSSFTSSICGGGRYDDLTGIFGLPGMSGVGISFGADRIYDVLEELNLFPANAIDTTRLLIVNFGGDEIPYALKIAKTAREAGINSELYPDAAKLKKQMAYADARKIPFVAIAGSEERMAGEVTLKEMNSGNQEKIKLNELHLKLKEAS